MKKGFKPFLFVFVIVVILTITLMMSILFLANLLEQFPTPLWTPSNAAAIFWVSPMISNGIPLFFTMDVNRVLDFVPHFH